MSKGAPPKNSKEAKILRNRKLHNILEHERLHKEQRENMQTADGGHTADISDDNNIDTLKESWRDKTTSMRASLGKRRSKAKAMWRGR